jgi:DNA repair protein RadC
MPITDPDESVHAAQLSDVQLMTVLLGDNDDSQKQAAYLLSQYGGIQKLAGIPVAEMRHVPGLTPEQIIRLAAAFELARRLNGYSDCEQQTINEAADAMRLVADMHHLKQEQVRLILLDLNNRVIAVPTLYIGTLHGTVLRAAEVFREALLHNCPAFILVHNHPLGEPAPSPEDIEITRALIAAGKLLDIQVLDHLIVAEQGWCSLKQQGLAFLTKG